MSEAMSYEQAVEQVEQILARIESGQVGLEQTIADCERGLRLIARCRGVLSAAEKRLGELLVDGDGGLREAGGEGGETADFAEDADAEAEARAEADDEEGDSI